MKRFIILALILALALLTTGCGAKQIEETDADSNNEKKLLGTQDTELLSMSYFRNLENWKTAYPYLEALGKSAFDISSDFEKWNYTDSGEGGDYFYDTELGIYYIFSWDSTTSRDNFGTVHLTGDEPCVAIWAQLSLFFPRAEWPKQAEGTLEYLKKYLGFEFYKYQDEYGWGEYTYTFENDKERIHVGCDDNGIISLEDYINISVYHKLVE